MTVESHFLRQSQNTCPFLLQQSLILFASGSIEAITNIELFSQDGGAPGLIY